MLVYHRVSHVPPGTLWMFTRNFPDIMAHLIQAASVCLGHMATPQWRLPLQSALPTMRCLWMAAGESKAIAVVAEVDDR